MERLFYDAVYKVRYLVAFANLSLFEADVLAAEMIEETAGTTMIFIIRQNLLLHLREADGRSYSSPLSG
jgi:hypothetical protein